MTGPSHEPLDEQERELARILRALPGAEPPAALDQRILRAAADAAAASPRRVRRWLAFGGAGWGIGGAAAAVLALGVGWHLLDPARNLPMERTSPVAPADQDDGPVTVNLEDRAAANAMAPPAAVPPPPPPPEVSAAPAAPARLPRATLAAPARQQRPVLPAPPPPPPPPAPPAPVEPPAAEMAMDAAPAPQAFPSEPAAVGGLSAEQVARLPAQERAREEAARKAADAAAASRVEAFQAEAAARASAGAPDPAAWLAQVRRLRDDGHADEAAASLRRFRQSYPQYAIPADLQPLLQE